MKRFAAFAAGAGALMLTAGLLWKFGTAAFIRKTYGAKELIDADWALARAVPAIRMLREESYRKAASGQHPAFGQIETFRRIAHP